MRLLLLLLMLFVGTITRGAEHYAFLRSHCLECHDSEVKKGGLDLSQFTDESKVMKDRGVWRSVYEKIESHQMPPPQENDLPSQAQRQEILRWIRQIAARPDPVLAGNDPGKPVLRRLTRLEYNNSIRDLFGLDMDILIFPERLPLRDKSYFQPGTSRMPNDIMVEMREYGAKYAVLCPQLGQPGDSRAEHGYRNRGDAMDFSPVMLEQYILAAQEIVNSPNLPLKSELFASLIGMEPAKESPATRPRQTKGSSVIPSVELTAKFAPDQELIPEAEGSSIRLADFRKKLATAYGDGMGGVFDVPKTISNQTVSGKGGLVKAAFGKRSLTINPDADIWLTAFSTAQATSRPAILTNKQKGGKRFELTFDIVSEDEEEGIEHLAFCVLGRKGQSGALKVTAVQSDTDTSTLVINMKEGEAGTTFVSFSALGDTHIRKLIVDGEELKGDYALLDDLAIITNGKTQLLTSTQPSPPTPIKLKSAQERVQSASKPRPKLGPHERLRDFTERALRRSLSPEENGVFISLFDDARKSGKSEPDAMRHAIAAVLSSPMFLYVEANGTPNSGSIARLENHELATRLALFLWSSTPDDELLTLVKTGKLHEPAILENQARRLLKDHRSRELSESFATQWLRLDQLYSAKPDRDLFKSFYAGPQGKSTLHGTALMEALLLFETVHVEDRSILEFLNADYTWLNPPLARLYGISTDMADSGLEPTPKTNRELNTKNSAGNRWRRVHLADGNRGGFMTMAAPLVVTSLPFRTSPVKRGAWILETIFNRPPTEPKVAFAIENDTKEAAGQMSIREKFEAHRSKAACYSCHIRLDPPGFALERYNPIGQWDGKTDAKGEWAGQAFDGPAGFKHILAQNPHEFTRGFIEHLLSYALGRKLEIYDMPTVEKIQQAAAADGWKFSRIVVEIAKSYPFTHVRSMPSTLP